MSNADMPAMPATEDVPLPMGGIRKKVHGGMTKREHFAGLAFQAYLSRDTALLKEQAAEMAVRAADCLLAELEEERTP